MTLEKHTSVFLPGAGKHVTIAYGPVRTVLSIGVYDVVVFSYWATLDGQQGASERLWYEAYARGTRLDTWPSLEMALIDCASTRGGRYFTAWREHRAAGRILGFLPNGYDPTTLHNVEKEEGEDTTLEETERARSE